MKKLNDIIAAIKDDISKIRGQTRFRRVSLRNLELANPTSLQTLDSIVLNAAEEKGFVQPTRKPQTAPWRVL
jgi:hypothetical protein